LVWWTTWRTSGARVLKLVFESKKSNKKFSLNFSLLQCFSSFACMFIFNFFVYKHKWLVWNVYRGA
jgi:hypothetical protein